MDIVDSENDDDPDAGVRARTRAMLVADAEGERRLEPDVGVEFARICTVASDELGLLGVVVTLMTAQRSQAVVGASDVASRDLEEIQFNIGEGPGHDAFVAGRPVLIPDLESAFPKWPGYVPAATRAGAGAAYTFPLQLGAVRFGVLTCYAAAPNTLTDDEITQGLIFAELATELLLDSSSRGSSDSPAPGLRDALHLRNEIYQAQGKVMVQLKVSLVEALARMRAHAFASEQDLTMVAIGVLAGTIQLPRDDQ